MFTTVIGVPFNSAGTVTGVAHAPRVLAQTGIAEPHFMRMVELAEPPQATPERGRSGLLAEPLLTGMVQRVEAVVVASLRAGDRPLVVGGDCPVLLPAVAAGQRLHGRVGLVFVDGHEDAWDPRLSPTGEAADSELGLALGRYRADLPAALGERLPQLDPAELVVLGARDAAELAEAGQPSIADDVEVLTPVQLRQTGMVEAATAAVRRGRRADSLVAARRPRRTGH
ncbi:MAG TPA: arginase family protein [Actinomycetes bacterium]|nr:arginase family protein [Actinomycetes bacterium]